MKKKQFKLTIEPQLPDYTKEMRDFLEIPHFIGEKGYGDSLCSKLECLGKSSIWKKIKEGLFKKEGEKCWTCGAENVRLNAHEFWKYCRRKRKAKGDKGRPIKYEVKGKKLIGIHHICSKCHAVKHFGLLAITPEEAEERINELYFRCKKRSPQELEKEIKKHSEEILTSLKRQSSENTPTIQNIIETQKLVWKMECSRKEEIKKAIKDRRKLTEELIGHFCKVNGCSREVFEKHWREIQRKEKKTREDKSILTGPDYGEYETLVESCDEKYFEKKATEEEKRLKAISKLWEKLKLGKKKQRK